MNLIADTILIVSIPKLFTDGDNFDGGSENIYRRLLANLEVTLFLFLIGTLRQVQTQEDGNVLLVFLEDPKLEPAWHPDDYERIQGV